MILKTIYTTLLTIALCCSCSKEQRQPLGGTETPPEGMAAVTLGSIAMDNDDASSQSSKAVQSRAGGSELMAVGETFRLYAFVRGKTDIRDLLVTRAYTIVSSAGKPKLNAGEKPLYLPLGDVDIYLVGPLTADVNKGQLGADGMPLSPNVVDIATKNGVFPTYNADLVASKTELKVVAGSANNFTATPLAHKMARVEFCLEALDDANYTDLLLKNVKLYKQATDGTFVFGADGGSITAATGESDIQSFSVIEDVKSKKYRTVQYMIPRQQTHLKIEVRFTCILKGETGLQDKRLTSGVLDVPLVGGKQNYFYSNPLIATTIKWRTRILPWNEVMVPNNGNIDGLVLSLSGLYAPETIGGKKCWRDLSGNGNHAEIFGAVSYNTNRYILPGNTGSYMKMLKSLGTNQNYTIEFVVKANSTSAATTLLHFASRDNSTNDREFTSHYPWTTQGIWFDSPYGNGNGGNIRLNKQPVTALPSPITNVNQWQVTRSANVPNGYIARMNGVAVPGMATTATTPLKEMLYNYIGCFANKTSLFGGELYSLRVYNRVLTDAELKLNYEADKEYYKL